MHIPKKWPIGLRQGSIRRCVCHPLVERVETLFGTRVLRANILPTRPGVSEFTSQRTAELSHIVALKDPADHLLRRQSNENADDDDADFANEFALAMQRSRQMEVHSTEPHQLCERKSK